VAQSQPDRLEYTAQLTIEIYHQALVEDDEYVVPLLKIGERNVILDAPLHDPAIEVGGAAGENGSKRL
jgi:hypothetical protein